MACSCYRGHNVELFTAEIRHGNVISYHGPNYWSGKAFCGISESIWCLGHVEYILRHIRMGRVDIRKNHVSLKHRLLSLSFFTIFLHYQRPTYQSNRFSIVFFVLYFHMEVSVCNAGVLAVLIFDSFFFLWKVLAGVVGQYCSVNSRTVNVPFSLCGE